MIRLTGYIVLMSVFAGCAAGSKLPIAEMKYPKQQLVKDYEVFRGALEELHPGIYWFTSRDSMDFYFEEGKKLIADSMSERDFRTLLTKVVAKMRCGHTAVNYSRKYSRYLDTASLKIFPLSFKALKDTLVVTANLNRDSILHRGTIVTSINGYPSGQLIDTFLLHVTGDGHSLTGRYQTISSYGRFGVLYKNIFGLTDSFRIRYISDWGMEEEIVVPVFIAADDSTAKADSIKAEKLTPAEKRKLRSFSSRSLQVDTLLKSGYFMLNSFGRGSGLRNYFSKTFRHVRRLNLKHLVIDVRSNGGGDAVNAILLTRYLSDHPFTVADSLYTNTRSSRYRDYIKFQPLYWLMTAIITKKRADGKYHFGYFERHRFRPFRKNHFDGHIYILTGGNSFSATTVFAQELKGQPNVTIIGEETGGGAYGNTAWIIPELTLPHSRLKLSIPRFRFVMRKELVHEGRGVIPDVHVYPTADDVRRGIDPKLEAVKRMVMEANSY